MSTCSPTILLTGATGFLGQSLLQAFLQDDSVDVVAVSRRTDNFPPGVKFQHIDNLDASTDWTQAFRSPVSVVVHTAARVHIMDDSSSDPLTEYRRVNVDGTLALARAAVAAGVRRFIFISSIKVNGETTSPAATFSPEDTPAPLDPYGMSKLEAERGLLAIAAESGMELVIIRPVLIYGPGVGANFRAMMTWVRRGIPLPLGSVDNRRSLVSVFNIVDFIRVCVSHPRAAGHIFLISDEEDISVSELIRRISRSMGRRPRLVRVPVGLMLFLAKLLKKGASAQRLLSSLQVSTEKNQRVLGWSPPVAMDAALQMTIRKFLESGK